VSLFQLAIRLANGLLNVLDRKRVLVVWVCHHGITLFLLLFMVTNINNPPP
jgi:hypothetical protein